MEKDPAGTVRKSHARRRLVGRQADRRPSRLGDDGGGDAGDFEEDPKPLHDRRTDHPRLPRLLGARKRPGLHRRRRSHDAGPETRIRVVFIYVTRTPWTYNIWNFDIIHAFESVD